MTMIADKLKKIQERCKCGVFITINEHRGYYKSVDETLEELRSRECPPEIDNEVRNEMVKRDQIIHVQVYPDTPNGFYDVYHWDLGAALDWICEAIKIEG